jgi:hypothetical protein
MLGFYRPFCWARYHIRGSLRNKREKGESFYKDICYVEWSLGQGPCLIRKTPLCRFYTLQLSWPNLVFLGMLAQCMSGCRFITVFNRSETTSSSHQNKETVLTCTCLAFHLNSRSKSFYTNTTQSHLRAGACLFPQQICPKNEWRLISQNISVEVYYFPMGICGAEA